MSKTDKDQRCTCPSPDGRCPHCGHRDNADGRRQCHRAATGIGPAQNRAATGIGPAQNAQRHLSKWRLDPRRKTRR
jgi:hypothetical protein